MAPTGLGRTFKPRPKQQQTQSKGRLDKIRGRPGAKATLQARKHKVLASLGYEGTIKLSSEAEEDLRWWMNNLSQWKGQKVSQPSPYCVTETDTSSMGWGACHRGEATGGCWGSEEQGLHINELELLVVFYALKSFLKREEIWKH